MPIPKKSFALLACSAIILIASQSGVASSKISVIHGVKNDVSPPLASLVGSTAPVTNGQTQTPVAQPTGPTLTTSQPDPVGQTATGTLPGVSTIINFEGQSANDNRALLGGIAFVPPDTNGAVGNRQFVQTVNVTFTVYNKATGAIELGPALLTDVWNGFGGLCESVQGGDPVVLFDQLAGRWIISQLAFNSSFTQNFQCIAVSKTSDATGEFNRYAFAFGSNLNDYPKFGVWPDAYYYSANMFAVSGGSFNFFGARACAFDRSAMLKGRAATAICFQNPPSVASLLPSGLDGSSVAFSGEPNFFVGIADTSDLNLFKFHVDFNTPANSSFTGGELAVAPFSEICARAINLACVPEPPPGEHVDGLGDRLMFRLAYRNFGDHESLVVNHTVRGGPLAAVRWYEIRNPGTTPAVYQQASLSDPDTNFWMASIAQDKVGNTAMGFSASSKSLDPSVYLVGRSPADPLGSMNGPMVLQAGSGVQLPYSFHRWGDYSSMAVDPTDDCTLWYTQEYYETSGTINWTTRITAVKFDNCR